MIKHLFFDFNGTIIDDVDLCLELLNDILRNQNKPLVDKKRYKEVFKFPIKQYYIDAGVDFEIESYESLAIEFVKKYQPRSLSECKLYDGCVDAFKKLNEMGVSIYILSASYRTNLLEQTDYYDITKYFKDILGIDNIHAASKVHIGINYMNENNINPDEAAFIGDTLHDYEVANAMGVKCYLVECGHQSREVLEAAGVEVLKNTCDIVERI